VAGHNGGRARRGFDLGRQVAANQVADLLNASHYLHGGGFPGAVHFYAGYIKAEPSLGVADRSLQRKRLHLRFEWINDV
jgi:hypothetical protein